VLEQCFGLFLAGASVGGEVRGMMYGASAALVIYFALLAVRALLHAQCARRPVVR